MESKQDKTGKNNLIKNIIFIQEIKQRHFLRKIKLKLKQNNLIAQAKSLFCPINIALKYKINKNCLMMSCVLQVLSIHRQRQIFKFGKPCIYWQGHTNSSWVEEDIT